MEEESLQSKLRRVTQQRKVDEEEGGQLRYQEASSRRLSKILRKKITTSFIGALAAFEQHFGPRVWGHGLPEEECTPAQLAWREVWEVARTEVLNNGNNQVRATENEVSQYTMSWNRYHMTIPARDSQEEK